MCFSHNIRMSREHIIFDDQKTIRVTFVKAKDYLI